MNHPLVKIIYTKNTDGNMNYREIRQRFLEKNKINKKPIVVQQVHDNDVIVVDKNYDKVVDVDGMITDDKEVALFARTSDCLPILFLDPNKKVIAAVHTGREGTFKRISQKTVEKMVKEFDSDPGEILIEIGPSIGGCCYEVSQEMVDFVKSEFGEEFLSGGNNNRNIDLRDINKKQLIEAGIKEDNIGIIDICTMCSDSDYFSYRKNPGDGNFASVIYLK